MDTLTVTAPEAKELENAIAHLVTQIDEIREQMKVSDVVIRQSDAEYALLKSESQILKKQTESILSHAWSML